MKDFVIPIEKIKRGVLNQMIGEKMPDFADSLVKALIEVKSAIKTENADGQEIEANITPDYTKLEKRLIGMFTENTGCHMLDSGGIYGRAWQRNRKIENWNELPQVNIDGYEDGDFTVNISTYHYLNAFLEITEQSEQYDREFQKFMESNDDCYLANMEDFASNNKIHELRSLGVCNTYNFENLLDEVLQFVVFEDEDGEQYIILQIHNGCDVRGGYTKPRIFHLGDGEYFWIGMNDIDCRCEKCGMSWYSDDSGNNWYYNECSSETFDGERDEELKTVSIEGEICHKNCKGKLSFWGHFDW